MKVMRYARRLFALLLFAVLLLACSQPFFADNSQSNAPDGSALAMRDYTIAASTLAEQYEALLPDLGIRAEEWNAEMSKCTEEEQKIMQYYFITTTMSDLCSIDFSLLHSYASHAVMLRETMPWTQALDEDTFLCYVASYRVYREPAVDCRPFFYDQLSELIAGKSLTEAVLLVNKWCGEQATYADSDQREASPLGMYNGGLGRCGEEANFVVNILRSVGIPARACNADWTVVADGHSFPQVLIDGDWHFIGACEPSPVLDNGWFTDRLGSLLDVQSYTLSDIGVEQALLRKNGLFSLNHVEDFTDVKDITLTVLDEQGQPAPNVSIDLLLVQNELFIVTIESLITDEKGEARYTLGCGSVGAVAYRNGDWRGVWIAQDQTEATISFAEQPERNVWNAFPVRYSEAETKRVQNYTEEEYAAFYGGEDLDAVRTENHANDFDAKRAAPYPDCEESLRSAGRNFGELIAFLEKDDDPMRSSLVAGLSDKYCREVSAGVLEDILRGAEAVRGELSDEDFIKGLLYPVSEWSYFSPQRLAVQQMFTEEQLRDFRANPSRLYQWFAENIHDDCLRAAKGGVPALSSALKMGYCPESTQTSLLMELARAVGIPVFLDEESNCWQYLGPEGWTSADWIGGSGAADSGKSYGTVQYLTSGSEAYLGLYWAIIGLSGENNYGYYCYWLTEDIDEDTTMDFPAGDYAMVLLDQVEKSGTLYVCRFTVEEGGTTTLSLPS